MLLKKPRGSKPLEKGEQAGTRPLFLAAVTLANFFPAVATVEDLAVGRSVFATTRRAQTAAMVVVDACMKCCGSEEFLVLGCACACACVFVRDINATTKCAENNGVVEQRNPLYVLLFAKYTSI